MQYSDDDPGIEPDLVQLAVALTSGRINNLQLLRASLDGRDALVIAAAVDAEDPEHPAATFLQPFAVLFDANMRDHLTLGGQKITVRREGESEEDWMARCEAEHQEVPVISGIPLDLTEAVSTLDALDNMADYMAAASGGAGIHSTGNGEWCVHLGSPDQQSHQDGCVMPTVSQAIVHAVEQHSPSIGNALFGPDDPRADLHLN